MDTRFLLVVQSQRPDWPTVTILDTVSGDSYGEPVANPDATQLLRVVDRAFAFWHVAGRPRLGVAWPSGTIPVLVDPV